MKKSLAMLLTATLCVGLFAGCSSNAANPTPAPAPAEPGAASTPAPAASLSGNVSTNGSTSMESMVGALMEQFMINNESVNITYDATGSGTGITAVSEGRCDIGLSSRALKDEEAATLTGTNVALDGIAIIVNPQNTTADISLENLGKLFTGEITSWSQVGGADGEIVRIGREGGSGTRDGFESITDTKDKCTYKQELNSTGGVIEAVKNNPNAIGYASLAAVEEAGDTVKILTVGGVAPSESTVLDGSYAVQRPFVLVTKTGTALSAQAQAFFDFAMSKEAAPLIEAAGAVPLAK